MFSLNYYGYPSLPWSLPCLFFFQNKIWINEKSQTSYIPLSISEFESLAHSRSPSVSTALLPVAVCFTGCLWEQFLRALIHVISSPGLSFLPMFFSVITVFESQQKSYLLHESSFFSSLAMNSISTYGGVFKAWSTGQSIAITWRFDYNSRSVLGRAKYGSA